VRPTARPLREEDRDALAAFLAAGMPADAYLLDALETGGLAGFFGAWSAGSLEGVAFQRRGAVSAAARTSAEAARSLAVALSARDPWTSVVGPEGPCSLFVDAYRESAPFRVDRMQTFMAVALGDPLGPGGSGVRRATAADLDALVPMIAAYRVEDGLSRRGDDHSAWIRTHTKERVESGNLFVIESGGRLLFTGAFNFSGRHGSGLGGIYTEPPARGRGLASRAVADMCRMALAVGPVATLHVAQGNRPAIRAYEKAGFRTAGTFRLTFR
jgi:RimJ/RimL family protein N-acetyltransferase